MLDLKAKTYTSQYTPPGGGNAGNPFLGGASSGQGSPLSGGGLSGGPSSPMNPVSFAGATQSSGAGKAYETFSVPERSNQHSSFLPEGAGNIVISNSGDIRGNKLNCFA